MDHLICTQNIGVDAALVRITGTRDVKDGKNNIKARVFSSVVERFSYTEDVQGANP